MKKVMLASLVAVLLTPYLSAQDQRHDGYWWKSLDDSRRLFFVVGFVEGINFANGELKSIEEIGNPNKDTKAAIAIAKDDFDYYGIYVGQFRDGVNSFYADYRNQGLPLVTAMIYVREQIKGKPQDQLDR